MPMLSQTLQFKVWALQSHASTFIIKPCLGLAGWEVNAMKKFFVLSLFLAVSAVLMAQVEVTKFLGIPVDGTKSEMGSKLKAKGFSSVPGTDMLEGEFNGNNVYVLVQTNNRKVWRIGMFDKGGCDETQIKINFNNLCLQFMKNSKYVGSTNQMIPEGDDISYEISVNNKRYQAVFYQKSQVGEDTPEGLANRVVWFLIDEDSRNFGKYVIRMFYENGYNMANGEDL